MIYEVFMQAHQLRIGIVTTYPPGMGSLNEYAFHFVQAFETKQEVAEIMLFVDELSSGRQYRTSQPAWPPTAPAIPDTTTQQNPSIRFIPCWRFNSSLNSWRILRAVQQSKPDVVIFNIQFASFGDRKAPAALGLMIPALLRLFGVPTVVLLHNIMETVDLKSAGFATSPLVECLIRFMGWIVTCLLLR
jgi:hypothetical protein